MPAAKKPIIPPITDSRRHECWVLYMAGWSMAEISRKTGESHRAIRGWSAKDKWTKQRNEIEAHRTQRTPPGETPLAKTLIADGRDVVIKRFETRMETVADRTSEHMEKVALESPEKIIAEAQKFSETNKMNRTNLNLDKEEAGSNSLISLTFLGNPDAVKLVEQPKQQQLKEQ